VNVFDVSPTTAGTYHAVCSEFCGLNHAFMTFTVKVVSPEAFEGWLSEQTTEATA
jgi:cytochrome c oxidase subunit 2